MKKLSRFFFAPGTLFSLCVLGALPAAADQTYACREMNGGNERYTLRLVTSWRGRLQRTVLVRESDGFATSAPGERDDFRTDVRPRFVDDLTPSDREFAEKLDYDMLHYGSGFLADGTDLYVSRTLLDAGDREGVVVQVDLKAYGRIGARKDLYLYLRCAP